MIYLDIFDKISQYYIKYCPKQNIQFENILCERCVFPYKFSIYNVLKKFFHTFQGENDV